MLSDVPISAGYSFARTLGISAMSQGSFSIDVNGAVLEWARKAAGQSVSAAAKRLGVSEQTVQQWEAGTKPPAWTSLRRLATFYQRPLAALLLSEPPQDPEVPPDFRTLPAAQKKLSSDTLLAIRTSRWLQSRAIEMRQELDSEIAYTAKRVKTTQNVETLARELRNSLGIDLEEQIQWQSSHEAYRGWRGSLEELGILVFQFPFPTAEVRGFSLFDPICPVIVVNESDDPIARVFTLLHEYGHLLLQEPGICLPQASMTSQTDNVEPFCNRLAGAILIPNSEIVNLDKPITGETELKQLARKYSVSKYVVLFRFVGLDQLSRQRAQAIEKQWRAADSARRDELQRSRTGGASAANICRRRRGKSFIELVQRAERRGVITRHDMVTYLGVKLGDLKKLESKR
jgi:Zn-dependent peptidase ImmA (M78 family)/DNA-binding XRE family transcriptional regulator